MSHYQIIKVFFFYESYSKGIMSQSRKLEQCPTLSKKEILGKKRLQKLTRPCSKIFLRLLYQKKICIITWKEQGPKIRQFLSRLEPGDLLCSTKTILIICIFREAKSLKDNYLAVDILSIKRNVKNCDLKLLSQDTSSKAVCFLSDGRKKLNCVTR